MRMRRTNRRSRMPLACLGLLLWPAAAAAQEFPTLERGFKPGRSFQAGDVDRINLFNGALSLTIPIGQRYPVGLGGELSYGLTLSYNNNVWDYAEHEHLDPLLGSTFYVQAEPVRGANAGLGWRLSLGEYQDQTLFGIGICNDCYISPDGAQHRFYQTLHPDIADNSTDALYTRDGTYLRLRKSAREIDFPNGEIHRFDSSGRLIQRRDRLGNVINVTYSANAWTINDGTRTHTVNLVNVSHYGKAVGSVVLKTFGGGQATYTFSYTEVSVARSCMDNDTLHTSQTLLLPLLTGITLPDGSSYSMPLGAYSLPSYNTCTESTYHPVLDHAYQYGSLKSSQFSTSAGALVLKTVNRTIDANTGLTASDTDAAGVTTAYSYDTLGRLTEVRPAEDAWLRHTYVAPISANARVFARRYSNGAWTTVLTYEELTLDDFGRLAQERRRMPGGTWARRTTLYDAESRATDVSEWQADAPNTAWTKRRNYDPFGRPGYVDPPEGSAHRVSFSYTGDRVVSRTSKVGTTLVSGSVGETSATVTETYDRQGRLYRVVDGTGTTTYGYDPAGRLTSVGMPSQTRTFTFDGRGFPGSETHPERGAAVSYSRYDARGNAGSRRGGSQAVDLAYDRAGRLLRIEVPVTLEPIKVFTYGSGTAAADRSAGKVKTAERYNYTTVGGTAFTARVRETYVYGQRSGRPSRRDTQLWINGAASESFTHTLGPYDDIGNPTTVSYPQCTHAGCSAPTPRSVPFTYNNNRLTAVTGWASPITYHPNGMMASVAHANGVTVSQTNDDWSRPLPKAIATTGAYDAAGTTASNWTTGNYVYDGSGNVVHLGSSRFVYDSLSRISSASLATGLNGSAATNATQSYVYNVQGSLTSTTTNGGVLNSPADATTNRLTGAVSYDGSGNLVLWNTNVYNYDRLGMVWRMKAGAIEDVYAYTADDERILSFHVGTGVSTWTLRDLSGKVLREYQNSGGTWSVLKDYVYREGRLLAAWTPSAVHHFQLDHLGTPRLITRDGGRRVAYHAYYPFGQEASSPTQDTERMKFTGHERDLNGTTGSNPAADDLDYMHARFFNPLPARFLNPDPGRDWEPRMPQSWHLYAYVRNRPLTYVDPYGSQSRLPLTADKGEDYDPKATFYDQVDALAYPEFNARNVAQGLLSGFGIGSPPSLPPGPPGPGCGARDHSCQTMAIVARDSMPIVNLGDTMIRTGAQFIAGEAVLGLATRVVGTVWRFARAENVVVGRFNQTTKAFAEGVGDALISNEYSATLQGSFYVAMFLRGLAGKPLTTVGTFSGTTITYREVVAYAAGATARGYVVP